MFDTYGYPVILVLVCVMMKYVVYPRIRQKAWGIPVGSPTDSPYCTSVLPFQDSYGFWGTNPGFDYRGIYQLIVHIPIYLILVVYIILYFPVMLYRKYRYDPFILDEKIFNMCTSTSLVLLGKFDKTEATHYIFSVPTQAPTFIRILNCDVNKLMICFDIQTMQILHSSIDIHFEEKTDDNTRFVRRNEVLIAALRIILAHWVHPTIHIASEKCAIEIQHKRIEALEPSSHFVSALHEGLLHPSSFGPLMAYSPFFVETLDPKYLVSNCLTYMTPPHQLSLEKNQFEFYDFTIKARKIVFELVQKYCLDVEPENVFLNSVLHGLDHDQSYAVLHDLPLISIDGTGSIVSYWRTFCFIHLWLKHRDNPLCSDLIYNHTYKAFYNDLYLSIYSIHPGFANKMVISCCF